VGHGRDLGAMRRSYEQAGLDERDVAATWLEQFGRWFDDAVAAGVEEPNAAVFATATPAGAPSARTVLVKGVDERGFVLYTNLGSRKGREALANPHASLVLPWIALARQVVVVGEVVPVGAAEADAYFASRPRGSQLGAAASPQSQVVPGREAVEAAQRALARRYPEGTAVPRPAGWGGLRVAPVSVEFWQGRPDRLHDRLRFHRAGDDSWRLERLAP
jgi:pyridoxamine 5'-phosphate oxidase